MRVQTARRRTTVLVLVVAVLATVATLVSVRLGSGPAPVRERPEAAGEADHDVLGGPESFADLKANADALLSRTAAPYATVAPGAYLSAVRHASHMSATSGRWRQYGRAPECGAPTGSDVCPPPSAANGHYTGVGSLGFRTLSGRVTDIAYDPKDHSRLWVSTAGGGVWQTNNAGASWHSVGDRLPTDVVGAIAYDAPRHLLLVGTGDNSMGGDGISGHGLYTSSNDGRSWHRARGVPDLSLGFRIVVSPADRSGRTIYFASSKGLYRSTDGGRRFRNERLPTSPPGYQPNCAGNTRSPLCFFANMVTDVVVKQTSSKYAPKGAVMAVVGWRAGQKEDLKPNGKPNMSCRKSGSPTACLQAPRNGIYISKTGKPGSFVYQDQSAHSTGFAANAVVGRTALGIANGPHQNNDAVYALVQDAKKFQGCLDVVDTSTPACNSTATGETQATYLDGLYATYNFGRSWTKIMDWSQLRYPGTNSALTAEAGYGPGIQSWYNLWVRPDPTTYDPTTHDPTRVVFGLEEIWENNLSVPGVLTQPWQLHQSPAPGAEPWRVIGRYWNACGGLNTPAVATCNPDLKSNPIPGTTTHPDQHASLFVPRKGGGVTLYAGSDGGMYKQTVAKGADFTNDHWGNGINVGLSTLQPYDAEMAKDGTVVSGLQDNGELKITPSGREFEIYGGDAFYNTIDPGNSRNIIEEYTYAALSLTRDGGQGWYPYTPNGCSGSGSDSLFSTPIEQDPTKPGHVVVGCTEIQEATKAYKNPCITPPGASAENCQVLTNPFVSVFNLGTAKSGTNYIPSALAVRGPAIYVGFCGYCDVVTGGLPFRSGLATNVGGTKPPKIGTSHGWHFLHPRCIHCGTPGNVLPQRYITSVQIDPRSHKTVYLTMGGYGRRWIPPGALGDSTRLVGKGHLFVSHNGGKTFRNVSGNLPDVPADFTAVHGRKLVVATDLGVFIGPKRGGHFRRLGHGLPRAPVFTVRVAPGHHHRLLLVSTYGRGDFTYRFRSRR